MMEGHDNMMIQAKEVYVLMKKDYRISRNIRASWFFENLQKTLQFTCQENLVDTNDELQVASVLPVSEAACVPGSEYTVSLLPSTMVTFIARRYRFVIILDLSPSVTSVDTASGSVLYEKVHKTLANFLQGLVLPFCLPGSQAVLSPELHITVIAYTPVKTFTTNQVLVQGLVINRDNIQKIVAELAKKLMTFESALAQTFSKIVEEDRQHYTSSYFDMRPPAFSSESSFMPKGNADILNNPEAGIVNMIRCGLLALQLLPENSSASLVVITDGCLGVPDANLFEFLLTQLRTSTIACTFLRVGEPRSPYGHFGHIPHTELMQFVATATFGSYFNVCPDVSGSAPNTLNAYHKAIFLWSFQRGLDGFRFDLGDHDLMAQQSSPAQLVQSFQRGLDGFRFDLGDHDLMAQQSSPAQLVQSFQRGLDGFRFDLGDHDLMAQQSSPAQLVQRLLSHPIHGKLASVMPNIRKKHSESTLNTSLFSVLSVRLREGYTIRDIAFTKGESQIEVRLVLPWREYARFEYLIRAAWPLEEKRHATFTETTIEGSYDFLHDMTCTKINTHTMSPFRSANVRKFWLALQGLSQTDQLLMHLQAFSSNPNNYTLPESIREGVPLFYLPMPTSTVPSLSTQLNTKDQVLNQFASFWRPVVNLDVKVWQKWTHTHRIGLVLEHDIPLHKNIHIANSSGRFTFVMCRQALMSLNKFLSGWSTFVLLDNQSYIKLIYENPEEKKNEPPTSFVLIRITSKAPCLVLRLAFLGGTPGYQRYELVKELKQRVSKLKFPQRGPKSDKNRRAAVLKKTEDKVVVKKAPLLREWSEIFCCVLLQKPVETILIRYERIPQDMTKVEDTEKPTPSFMSQTAAKTKTAAMNMYNSLARYLLHQRWIYTVQQPGVNSISMQGIGRILSTLTKMRIQEGFHFSLTNSGVVNLILEVDMKDAESSVEYSKTKQRPTCVVQYIMFPPHVKTATDNLSDEEADEMESPEDDGELQLIIECWVEPQYGVATNSTPERAHWEGLTSEQITNTFQPLDLKCISSLLTFQHLMYLCQNCVIPADLASIVNSKQGSQVTSISKTVQHVAFPFDLLSVLPRSQQAELIYPTFTYDVYNQTEDAPQYGKDANQLLFSLFNDELTQSSHRKVTLSHEQSCAFFNHLNTRSRNTDINPFPFEIDNFLVTDSAKQEKEPEKTHSRSASSSQPVTANTAKKPGETQDNLTEEAKSFPQWQCFIKAVGTNSLILTFVPASFEDILLLNKRTESADEVEDVEENAKPEDDKAEADKAVDESAALSQAGQTESAVENAPHKKAEAEGARDSDKTHTSSVNTHTEEQPEGDKTEIPENTNSDKPEEDKDVDSDRITKARRNFSGDSSGSNNTKANANGSADVPPPLKFPVYSYDCNTSNLLDSLINPWTFQLQGDIFQDKRFDFQIEINEMHGPSYSPRHSKRVSFNLDMGKDEEDGVARYSMRSLDRRSTEGSSEGGENLWQHYYNLSEIFYNCYVKGVFQGLQKGFPIMCQDVDAAINNICEESLPLETNITSFLHATCGHFQQFVNEVRRENEVRLGTDDGVTEASDEIRRENSRLSVRFDVMDDMYSDGEPRRPSVPNVLELPQATVTFDLASLHLDRPCEAIRGLHPLIRNKFQDIVQKWFRNVPNSPDYYVYCPERPMTQVEEMSDGRETTASETVAGTANTTDSTTAQGEADTTTSTVDTLKVVRDLDASHDHEPDKSTSTVSTKDSEESSEDEDDLEFDLAAQDKSSVLPLFINFTCTVKSHLQQYSVSMKDMASCLGDLASELENMTEVDLGDLKITFDLNCLTLPSDLDSVSPRRPSCLRMLSNSSTTGNQSSSSSENGDRASSSHLGCVKHLKDPIFHLPPTQHDAVNKCVEEIEWLLKDEIVSNLRNLHPISCNSLSYVSQHIQASASHGKANVNVEQVPLQFVFGPDQSCKHFLEEFQKMNLQAYQLIKEGEWYYLSRRRYSYISATMLSSALTDISYIGQKTAILNSSGGILNSSKPQSPSTKSETSEHSDAKYAKNLSPLVASQKDKIFDIGMESVVGRSSPLTVRSDSQADTSKEGRRLSRESSLALEKRTSAEGLSLENLSLINRRRSKDLVLKMMKGLGPGERRRSQDGEAGMSPGERGKGQDGTEASFSPGDRGKSIDGTEADTHSGFTSNEMQDDEQQTNDGILRKILQEASESVTNGDAKDCDKEMQAGVTNVDANTNSDKDKDISAGASGGGVECIRDSEAGHVVQNQNQHQHDISDARDSTASPAILDLSQQMSQQMCSPVFTQISSPITSTPTAAGVGTPRSGTDSQLTSAVQSPVVSDVSIQLIKTDGRCEPFRTSPERRFEKADDSFDSLEMENENEGVLKRCSSFAGFHSEGRVVTKGCDTPVSESGIQTKVPLQGPLPGMEGRARHCSAPLSGHPKNRIFALPQTPSCISSRGSFAEDGLSYDGDQSEMDDSATIFSESGVVHRLMPNFWLIMQISNMAVDILFQLRETGQETNEETLQNRSLLAQVKANVEQICRKVNQQLLLNDLYETRMCHTLLVDAADEDVSWKLDKGPRLKTRQHNVSSSENDDDDDDDTFERKYLAAAMDLDPGHFDCPCVWKTQFVIHPGLKRGSSRAAIMSVGVTALRSVLNPFSVNNRNNMFVTKESTGNVCYLRLKEVQSMSRATTGTDELTESTSMGTKKDSMDMLTPGDKEADTVSIGSSCSALSLSQSHRGPLDCVELHVHGIEEAGKEIREHLVQMLQNRLDEKTLDKICEMLRRNPQCQLERADVQFIQKLESRPILSLQLVVNNKVSPHLGAVMYYLRQNLLQYLHPPRYKTNHTDSHFMDVFDGKLSAIPSDQAFLYIPSHTARKTGIACVSMCLVDGQGNQVKLLQCPAPLTLVEAEVPEQKDLEEYTVTQVWEAKPHSKKPGPTAMIQFHVWECGDIELPFLRERLVCSLRHALCDLVMEYHLLAAPICELPKHLVDMLPVPPPTHSAPSSPFHCMPAEEFRERKFSMVTLRKHSDFRPADRRASMHTSSKFQSLKDALLQPTKKLMSPSPDGNKMFELPGHHESGGGGTGTPSPRPSSPMSMDRSRSGSPRKEPLGLLSRYESGEMGTLHRVFSDVMEGWLDYCWGLETPAVNQLELNLSSRLSMEYVLQELPAILAQTPAVNQLELNLSSRLSMEYVLQELPAILAQVCEGTRTCVFKTHPPSATSDSRDEDANIATPYRPNRTPFTSHRRKSETSLDSSKQYLNITPGEDRSFTIVGRNLDMWYRLMQHAVENDPADHIPAKMRGKLAGQRFEAHFPTVAESKSFGMFSESSYLIPRQTLIFILLKNTQMHVYTYNLTNEVFVTLSRNLGKLVQWNNARSQLLTSIVIQKCGFYNHFLFGDISSTQADSFDQLISNPAPPSGSSKEKLTRTSSTHSVRETYLHFDVTFKDLYPKKPLHLSDLLCEGDPVRQFGKQAQYIRLEYKKEMMKMNSIGKLYVMWLQKSSPNYPIDEDTIKTLKQASRLFHYCATPLLFSAKWRQLILEKYKVSRQDSVASSTVSTCNTPDTKSRSRHGSGTSTGSMRTKRTDSSELKKRPSLSTFKEVHGIAAATAPDGSELCTEEEWHQELRSDFIYQYIKYLQSIGFNHVQMDKSQDKAKARRRNPKSEEQPHTSQHGASSGGGGGEDSELIKACDVHNLQKTVSGGILLIELSFRQEYFCVKLYTCDHNKLGITVNQQLKLLFVDECEKYKGLIHVHSFAHDFHLRYIQAYVSGRQELLKPGYYLSGLLTDFVKVYPYAPSFSRNFLLRDVVTIPKPTCSSEELYEYMLKHANLHSMSVLKMVLPEHEPEQDSLTKSHNHALISHEKREVPDQTKQLSDSKQKVQSYNIGLVILENSSQAGSATGAGRGGDLGGDGQQQQGNAALRLQFYIILTSSQDIFPRHSLEKDVLAKTKYADLRLEMPDLKQQIAIMQSPGLQTQMTNYLGYSNRHQPPMYQLLQQEAMVVKAKIESMAVVSMDKCRRDCLWTKMLMGVDQTQDDKKKKRSDTEDRDAFGRLSYEEFQELLTRVHVVPMHESDARLVHFLQMGPAWYQGLAHVLNNKYAENVKRCYTNPDNNKEKHLVIINPMCLDLVMLLSIDSNSGKTGLYSVYRKPAKEQECLFPGAQNLPAQSEQFVNACCYHLWSSML